VDEDEGAPVSARDEVLPRVRSALTPEAGQRQARDIPRDYRTATDDGLDQFLERLAHYDARGIRTTPAELASTVRATLEDRAAHDVITPDGVPEGWLSPEMNLLKDDPPLDNQALDDADGVLTTCALAIAQTGTVVLDGGPGMGRRALTLLPDYHLCVARTEQIVSSVPEALARLDPVSPLTFISGPSATVDIEMVRVKGVHGPRTLDVILVTTPE
jgi:L-lactate dehydrogenase complex protein LldG